MDWTGHGLPLGWTSSWLDMALDIHWLGWPCDGLAMG
jgi:hypothetical protein